MVNIFKNKKGATIIILTLLITILFPFILSSIMDFANMYRIEKRLKSSLNLSVKSASSRIDWDKVPDGDFLINEALAKEVFVDIFNRNMTIDLNKSNDYYEYTRESTGNTIKVYTDIYNKRHEGTFESFPKDTAIPTDVTDHQFVIKVDRPTIIGIAVVEYKLSPLLGGKTVEITGFASSQLNQSF